MISEFFQWWLIYGAVLMISVGALELPYGSRLRVKRGCIFILFVVPMNGVCLNAMYNSYYLKWFLG